MAVAGEDCMERSMSAFHFKAMAFLYRIRDLLYPREKILEEVGIEKGFHVLDFGCGPGGYVKVASQLAGESGRVYALDMHPLAIQMVKDIASKNRLTNVEAILSDCKTGLPDSSMDAVLLYDALHALSDPHGVLEELHRVLKPHGILSASDHHMKEEEIMSRVTNRGLFRLRRKGKSTYTFIAEK